MLRIVLIGLVGLIALGMAEDKDFVEVDSTDKLKDEHKDVVKIESGNIVFNLKKGEMNEDVRERMAVATDDRPFTFTAKPDCKTSGVELVFKQSKHLKWTFDGSTGEVDAAFTASPFKTFNVKSGTSKLDPAVSVTFWTNNPVKVKFVESGNENKEQKNNHFDLAQAKDVNGNKIKAVFPRFKAENPQCNIEVTVPKATLWAHKTLLKDPSAATPKTSKATTTTTTTGAPDGGSTDETPATAPGETEDTTPTSGTGGLGLPCVLLLGVGALLLCN